MDRSDSHREPATGGGSDVFPDTGDRYAVEAIVSAGPPSIYRALDHELGRTVALKALGESGPADVGAAVRLAHPNILTTYDLLERDGRWYAVLEWVDGGSLRTLLDENPHGLDAPAAFAIARKLADALHHAHQRGLVHGDVRPGNVLLDRALQPKLKGFAGPDDSREPAERDGYLVPEQAAGEAAGAATDIYQLGMLLVEMLTGRPAEHDELPRELPPGLRAFLGRALSPRPEERPDAASFSSALAALADAPLPPPPPMPAKPPARGPRRRGMRLLIAAPVAIAIAAAVGMAAFYAASSRDSSTPAAAPSTPSATPVAATGVPYSASSLLDALDRASLRPRPTGERACESGAVPGIVYRTESGARFVLWVYPSQSVLRQDWTVAAGRAPAPRIANCFQQSGLRYWNANLVLIFPDSSTNADVRTRITSAFLGIR